MGLRSTKGEKPTSSGGPEQSGCGKPSLMQGEWYLTLQCLGAVDKSILRWRSEVTLILDRCVSIYRIRLIIFFRLLLIIQDSKFKIHNYGTKRQSYTKTELWICTQKYPDIQKDYRRKKRIHTFKTVSPFLNIDRCKYRRISLMKIAKGLYSKSINISKRSKRIILLDSITSW